MESGIRGERKRELMLTCLHLLVSPHFMRGRELSTLVVILSFCLSVIMGIHFQAFKLKHRVLYSH